MSRVAIGRKSPQRLATASRLKQKTRISFWLKRVPHALAVYLTCPQAELLKSAQI